MGGEFLEGEFFRGPLLLEKNRVKKFDPKIRASKIRGASKIRFPEFGPKFGFRRHKIQNPLCRLVSLTKDSLSSQPESDEKSADVGVGGRIRVLMMGNTGDMGILGTCECEA